MTEWHALMCLLFLGIGAYVIWLMTRGVGASIPAGGLNNGKTRKDVEGHN